MRTLFLGVLAGALVGCVPQQQSAAPATSSAQDKAPSSSAPPKAPPAPKPTADGPCPYLSEEEVRQANGLGVESVKVSTGNQPHPTCFFYHWGGVLQLTVRIYVGKPEIATAIVDEAAPIDASNPADDPPGWTGGYLSTEDSAVYAIAKGGKAVVVTTNQAQSVKARTAATDAIANLKL